jgi:hypothetical protein
VDPDDARQSLLDEGYEVNGDMVTFTIKPELGALFQEIMQSKKFEVQDLLLQAITDSSPEKLREILELDEELQLTIWTYLNQQDIEVLQRSFSGQQSPSEMLKKLYLQLYQYANQVDTS